MDRFDQNTADSASFCAPDVRKKLIADKKSRFFCRPHPAHRLFIAFYRRLIRLENIVRILYILCEAFYARFLIVRQKHRRKADGMQPFKQRFCTVVRRRTMRHQRIVHVINQSAVSFSVQPLVIDSIGGIRRFIRIKNFQHAHLCFILSDSCRLQQLFCVFVLRGKINGIYIAAFDNCSVLHNHNSVAELINDAHIVRNK